MPEKMVERSLNMPCHVGRVRREEPTTVRRRNRQSLRRCLQLLLATAFLPAVESFVTCRIVGVPRVHSVVMHAENPFDKQKFLSGRKESRGGDALNAARAKPLRNLDISKAGSHSFLSNGLFSKQTKEPGSIEHCTETESSPSHEEDELRLLLREASLFPKFDAGLIVEHKKHGYRAVVLASDRGCKASEEWMEAYKVDTLERGRTQPFYTLLVDSRERGPAQTVTYAAEENLFVSQRRDAVLHPLVLRLFEGCEERPPSPQYPPEISFDLRYTPGSELEGLLAHLREQRQRAG